MGLELAGMETYCPNCGYEHFDPINEKETKFIEVKKNGVVVQEITRDCCGKEIKENTPERKEARVITCLDCGKDYLQITGKERKCPKCGSPSFKIDGNKWKRYGKLKHSHQGLEEHPIDRKHRDNDKRHPTPDNNQYKNKEMVFQE